MSRPIGNDPTGTYQGWCQHPKSSSSRPNPSRAFRRKKRNSAAMRRSYARDYLSPSEKESQNIALAKAAAVPIPRMPRTQRLLTVTTEFFTAKATWIGGSCVKTDPQLRWMVGQSPNAVALALLRMQAHYYWTNLPPETEDVCAVNRPSEAATPTTAVPEEPALSSPAEAPLMCPPSFAPTGHSPVSTATAPSVVAPEARLDKPGNTPEI